MSVFAVQPTITAQYVRILNALLADVISLWEDQQCLQAAAMALETVVVSMFVLQGVSSLLILLCCAAGCGVNSIRH